MQEYLVQGCLILGSFFSVTAALGVVRFPDFYTRMHAASKVSSFGIGFFLLALIIKYPEINIIIKSLLCLFFIVLTVPISGQMLMRVAYISGIAQSNRTQVDEAVKIKNDR